MGQQQLLLIVLGVIIVGIAIVVGINLFNANAEESAKDTLVSEGTNLGAMAQQFYKKPKALGGGGNTFDSGGVSNGGFVIPPKLETSSIGNIKWVLTKTAQSCTFTFTNVKATTGYNFSTVVITVTPSEITSVVNN
jgi:hypothetical protein